MDAMILHGDGSSRRWSPGATCVLLWVLAGTFLPPAGAAEKKIVLRDCLNRAWSNERVTYLFDAPVNQCAPQSVALTGPDGPVAVQLTHVQLWPGTAFLKSAELSFVVQDLAPLASRTYVVTYGPQAVVPAAIASDLKATATGDAVEIVTGRFGVRTLSGEKTYDTPSPAAEVPGPVRGMRLPDGTWFGGSRLHGPGAVKSWSSRLTDYGPVSARVETIYTYADGDVARLAIELIAGDSAVLMDMDVTQDQPDDGWDLVLSKGVSLSEAVRVYGQRYYVKEGVSRLDPAGPQPVCSLSPWPGDIWFTDAPSSIRLKVEGHNSELHLSVRDVEAWFVPESRPIWSNFTRWTYEMIPQIWAGWQRKRMPLSVVGNEVTLSSHLCQGTQKWVIGAEPDGQKLLDRHKGKAMSVHGPLPRLNEVKDMVLDWPDGRDKHPYLFMDLREMEAAGQRHAAALGDARDVEALRKDLDALSAIDLMRHVIGVACRYDAIIDSALISPQDRALFKAQAAFLAYQAAGAFHWSFERGYCSGNPNMTVSRIIGIGILGCALRDHPMGKTWAMYAIDWAKYWLAEVTDEKGGWPESSHYARVSWADLIQLAIVARRAGYHDFFADPKFLEMGRFYEKTLMPADPLHRLAGAAPGGAPRPFVRVTAPYGRGTRDDAWGLSGLLARATSATDPAYSRMMQWSWRESGFVEMFCHTTAGLAALYAQRDLPAQPPDWRSEFLPSLGYLLRSHVGTPFENYLLFVSQYYRAADGEIWPADTGGIAKWFARGQPVGGAFPRYPETSHALLENRVLLACNWDPETGTSPESGYVTRTRHDGFASLPGLDYVSAHFEIPEIKSHLITMPKDAPTFPRRDKPGLPPFQWQRQLLYVRDTEPQGPTYIVLRDTVRGGQPTQWHFWTLSQKMGTPEDAAQRDTFLRDRPGNKAAPLRALHGNRFTALGQFDMDLEYYVAAPIDTPRYTLRYGISGGAYGVANFDEYQDLLHLQLPGDGCYFVAMFPRSPKAEPPEFTTLGEDGTLRISGTFGTDYCFLESSPTEEEYRDVSFNGTAGIVQDRLSGLVLTLAASGTVRYREYELSTSVPVSLKVAPYALSLDFPSDSAGGTVSLRSPERWSLVRTLPGVRLDARGRHLTVTVPTGVTTVQFRSRQ